MKRRLLNLLTAASLLLAVAAGALWARSRETFDELSYARGGDLLWVLSARERVIVYGANPWPVNQPVDWQSARRSIRFRTIITLEQPVTTLVEWYPDFWIYWGPATVRTGGTSSQSPVRGWSVSFHCRALLVVLVGVNLLLLAPRACVAARRWRRRVSAGRCGKCGYDLRATPHRCPECGTPVGHVGAPSVPAD